MSNDVSNALEELEQEGFLVDIGDTTISSPSPTLWELCNSIFSSIKNNKYINLEKKCSSKLRKQVRWNSLTGSQIVEVFLRKKKVDSKFLRRAFHNNWSVILAIKHKKKCKNVACIKLCQTLRYHSISKIVNTQISRHWLFKLKIS